jgi:hypothetical protein
MDIHLHQRSIIPLALPLAWGNMRNVPGMALCLALEVVATTFITKKRQNNRTDCCTPMNISQKWTKMATSMMELGERCYNWTL